MEYNIAIVGTGPAGLEAAITAKLRNKSILLLGKNDFSEKIEKAQEISNYLGIPNISGCDLNKAFFNHLKMLKIDITIDRVTNIFDMSEKFVIQAETEKYYSKVVILATGVNFGKPLKNEEKFLGRGVSYCATCDGNLYRNKKLVVISTNKKEEKEVNYLAEIAREIVFIPLYKDLGNLKSNIIVKRENPIEIIGEIKASKLITNKAEYDTDGIFILRDAIRPQNLVPGLITEEDRVVVNKKMETNIEGLFACGDIVGKPYQAIKAAGEGNVAALSAVDYLDE